MDNITAITNYLVATAAQGELASEIRRELFEQLDEILQDGEFREAFMASVETFVNVTTEPSVEMLNEHPGEDALVAAIIASVYASGLSLGIAIASKAAEG